MSGSGVLFRRVGRDQTGASLPELLVGMTISGLIMVAITSAIFTTSSLQRRADDKNTIASALSIVGLVFDRDGAMATATAPATSQTSSTGCTTVIDFGFQEGGASVRFRTTAQGTAGPYWFERVSGAETRTLAKHVASCSWQAVQDTSGDWMLRLDVTITGGTGETATQTLRVTPRLW